MDSSETASAIENFRMPVYSHLNPTHPAALATVKITLIPSPQVSPGICSVCWKKNGYHHNIQPRASKQANQLRRPAIIPTRSSSSRPRRSCPSDFNPGCASAKALITNSHSTLSHNPRLSCLPSQLTLAAKRKVRIVKKSVAKAHIEKNVLHQRSDIPNFAYISEENDRLYDHPCLSAPPLSISNNSGQPSPQSPVHSAFPNCLTHLGHALVLIC
ncbi:hypothetical protein PTTG_04766 [Puccinia triticina 1-1 BBBD Race 1]|uniref:Uncharacterized protein n=1 Tax=Puccinia triticina (isolate 1-1 / race 1 (BBBD)) TaxID=630390 RepID=A0A0C4EVD3_PUCT1|nr:hypothetical protein PTTG_04766 [Puccinia triticina 1-1 BBBD Race 1]